ncbi:MAG: pilus assembly protein CpaE [Chloroflexota bacterium]
MISLEMAQKLRDVGLIWHPTKNDFFVLPERNLDHHIFVVSELTALIEQYNKEPVVTFHGSSEWALDYVLIADAVWLPTETQLRQALAHLIGDDAPLRLDRTTYGYCCQIAYIDQMLEFRAPDGETAYALAILYILEYS